MPDYSIIKNGIFIGNVHSVIGNYSTNDDDILSEINIKVVISALTEEEYEDYMIGEQDFHNIEWIRLVIDDDKDEKISQYFFEVHNIINKTLYLYALST